MITFTVPDMSCEHCAQTIQQAVLAADREARVSVDVGRKRVAIDPAVADARALREAITQAGYSPEPA